MPSTIDRTRVGTFLGALVVLWLLFEAATLLFDVSMLQLAPLYMFTPLLAAAVTVLTSDAGIDTLGVRLGNPRWLLVSAVLPLVLAVLATGVAIAVPGIAFSPGATLLPGVQLPSGIVGTLATIGVILVLGVTVNAVMAVGEEVGWRGYLLWELAPLGYGRASLAIGAIWGLWHAPVIVEGYNYPSFPLLGVLVMTAATITFAFVYTALVARARSVLAAVFFHGVFNASGGLVLAWTQAESAALSQLVASPVGAASMAVFLALAGLTVARGAPALERDRLFAAAGSSGDPLD
jgi:membrane protease YdiL (CAAX protease family)